MNRNTALPTAHGTWNPVVGCTKCSLGCLHCYALDCAVRLARSSNPKTRAAYKALTTDDGADWSGTVRTLPERLAQPRRLRAPSLIVVCSMSDIFHPAVPLEFIQQVFAVAAETPRHTFKFLTKRASRMAELAPELPWPPNIWPGVTVESADYVQRIDELRKVPAALRFLSIEPLLGPMPKMDLKGIHWAVVGAESGAKGRPMDVSWVRDVRNQCVDADVLFFLKQMRDARGRMVELPELDGWIWPETPAFGGLGTVAVPQQPRRSVGLSTATPGHPESEVADPQHSDHASPDAKGHQRRISRVDAGQGTRGGEAEAGK